MSDPSFNPPQPGDPGTPRDVNRPEDVVWDGTPNDDGQERAQEQESQPRKATKATKSTKSDKSDSSDSQ